MFFSIWQQWPGVTHGGLNTAAGLSSSEHPQNATAKKTLEAPRTTAKLTWNTTPDSPGTDFFLGKSGGNSAAVYFLAAGFHAVFDVVDAGEPLLTPLAFQILTPRGAWHHFRPKAWLDSFKPITGTRRAFPAKFRYTNFWEHQTSELNQNMLGDSTISSYGGPHCCKIISSTSRVNPSWFSVPPKAFFVLFLV